MTRPLTVKEAADRLGIKPGSVYQLCAARKLRHERYGVGRGTIRITEEAIEEYRECCVVEPAVPQATRRHRHLT